MASSCLGERFIVGSAMLTWYAAWSNASGDVVAQVYGGMILRYLSGQLMR